jgi:hypothetical protein
MSLRRKPRDLSVYLGLIVIVLAEMAMILWAAPVLMVA